MISVLVELEDADVSAVAMGVGAPPFAIDPQFAPVRMPPLLGFGTTDLVAFGARSAQPRSTVVVRAEVADYDRARALEQTPGVLRVWSDPAIDWFHPGSVKLQMNPVVLQPMAVGVDCTSNTSTGTHQEVANLLGAPRLWMDGFRGQGVVIGIVDGGVNGQLFPVDGGWSPNAAYPPGNPNVAWQGHGNMCAFDSLIAAPDARIFDYRIGMVGPVPSLLSAALQSFQHAIDHYRLRGTPQVLSNSWGLYRDSWDAHAPGTPGNYTHDANHPFTRKVVEAMDAGILVTFAAGNCGVDCPDQRCASDVGPGRSIRGANGHERVICVAGVNLRRQRLGYGSQGPATLYPEKPDVCGYSHFLGYSQCDNGTSAACPVVSGGLAVLRSAVPQLRQNEARAALTRTAMNLGPPGWDPDTGAGVVNIAAAYQELRVYPPAPSR